MAMRMPTMMTTVGTTAAGHTPDELLQAKIPPDRLPPSRSVHGSRDSERGVLVGHDVVLVFRVERLVLGRDVYVFNGQEGRDHGRGRGRGAVCHCGAGGIAPIMLVLMMLMLLLGGCRGEVGI